MHPGARGLDLVGVKLLRTGAAEAVDSPIDFKRPHHGMVKIDGALMAVPAALAIRQATGSAIRQRMCGVVGTSSEIIHTTCCELSRRPSISTGVARPSR